jgi:hypothetical protein
LSGKPGSFPAIISSKATEKLQLFILFPKLEMKIKVVSVSKALKIGRSSEEEMFNLIAGDLKQIVDENRLLKQGEENGRNLPPVSTNCHGYLSM